MFKESVILAENPVLCDERLYDLIAVLESLNARVSGVTSCGTTVTDSPVIVRALNDGAEDSGGMLVLRVENSPVQVPPVLYRRVGALVTRVLPEPLAPPPPSANVVVKWPDERPSAHAHTQTDFRRRDIATPL